MPYRSVNLLKQWVQDFTSQHPNDADIRVVPLVGQEDCDVGTILFAFPGGSTAVLIEPTPTGHDRWRVHFDPNDEEAAMSSAQVHAVAAGLEVCATLCDFIEARSTAHLASL